MVKKYKKEWQERSGEPFPTHVGKDIYKLLEKMGGKREYGRMAALWDHWEEAVGEDLAWIRPGGHKDSVLLLYAEDAMEIQELSLMAAEILARVNSWLKGEYFSGVKIDLLR